MRDKGYECPQTPQPVLNQNVFSPSFRHPYPPLAPHFWGLFEIQMPNVYCIYENYAARGLTSWVEILIPNVYSIYENYAYILHYYIDASGIQKGTCHMNQEPQLLKLLRATCPTNTSRCLLWVWFSELIHNLFQNSRVNGNIMFLTRYQSIFHFPEHSPIFLRTICSFRSCDFSTKQ